MKMLLHAHHEGQSPFEVVDGGLQARLQEIEWLKAPSEPPEKIAVRTRLLKEVEVSLPKELEQAYGAWAQAEVIRKQVYEWNRAYAAWTQTYAAWKQANYALKQAVQNHMPLLMKLHDELCVQPQRAAGFDCVWTPEHPSIW